MSTIWDTVIPAARASTVQERFETWLATPDGQRVYYEILNRALGLLSIGVTHYGIAALWEAVRYDWTVRLGPSADFRLNNDYRSRLARRMMADVPKLDGFFETRELKA